MTKIDSASDLTQARLNALFELSEWQKLLIHFDLAPDSFAFIPVFVHDSSWAELCCNVLADFLRETEKKQLLEINLKTPDELKNLAATFLDLKPKKKIGALWISAPIPFQKDELAEWKGAWRVGMARLNQYRNPFREKFDVPVLLVGAEWTKEITRNMAPDLWSVITISVRIEPSTAISDSATFSGSSQIKAAGSVQTSVESWRGVDSDFALKEAERLRGQPGKELGLARLLYRAASGFLMQVKYRESLQASTEAAKIIQQLSSEATKGKDSEIELFLADILNTKGIALCNQGRLPEAIAEYDKSVEIYKRLVNQENRGELANRLATAYLNKGNALDGQGKLVEAFVEYDKAIEILKRLVKEENRGELANDLAGAYLNKSNALNSQGRPTEAIAECDKAIAIYERLVNQENRGELANDLAMAYTNKGVALDSQGRPTEAIAEYDKAIEILERLVKEENRGELANDLAGAYLNKGSAFGKSNKFDEAIAEYDKAIAICERLVNQEKREELENNLAMTYWGSGIALASLDMLTEAVDRYNEAINIWEKCLRRNEYYILPNLFTVLYLRVRDLLKIENWSLIAKGITQVFNLRDKVFEYPDLSEHFKLKISHLCNAITELIREVPTEKREEIYKHAGEEGEKIRQLVDYFEENAENS